MGDDKYNEYALKVRHLKNGHIEATYKLINVKEDKGQIKEGHIYTMDMYKKQNLLMIQRLIYTQKNKNVQILHISRNEGIG